MACSLCDSDIDGYVYRKVSMLKRCKSCGFVYVAGEYSRDTYGQEYFTQTTENRGRDFFSDWSKAYDEARFVREIGDIRRIKKKGKILDVGCAIGSFMKMMFDEGFEPYGVDVSPFAIDYIKTTYGFPAFSGFLDEIQFKKEYFDIITLHHVLEHIHNPLLFLRRDVQPLLKQDGCLIVEVPNFRSFESVINREDWEDLKPGEHINHFTPKTLRLCLQKAGFKVVMISTYSPYIHKQLWQYYRILSFIGLPDAFIKKLRANHLAERIARGAGNIESNNAISIKALANKITRCIVMPLNLLYNKMRMGKYLVAYAQRVSSLGV